MKLTYLEHDEKSCGRSVTSATISYWEMTRAYRLTARTETLIHRKDSRLKETYYIAHCAHGFFGREASTSLTQAVRNVRTDNTHAKIWLDLNIYLLCQILIGFIFREIKKKRNYFLRFFCRYDKECIKKCHKKFQWNQNLCHHRNLKNLVPIIIILKN